MPEALTPTADFAAFIAGRQWHDDLRRVMPPEWSEGSDKPLPGYAYPHAFPGCGVPPVPGYIEVPAPGVYDADIVGRFDRLEVAEEALFDFLCNN